MKPIECDPERLLPLKNEPFQWPDNPDDFQNLVDRLHEKIFDFMQNARPRPEFHPLSAPELIAAGWPILIQSFIKILQTASAASRSLSLPSTHYPFWRAYIAGEFLPDHPSCTALLSGPGKDKIWRWPARMLRNRAQQNIIRRDPLFLFNPVCDTAVTGTDKIVQDFCRAKSLKGFYTEPSSFFRRLRRGQLNETIAERQLIDELSALMNDILERRVALSPAGKAWLRRQISITLLTTQRYVAQAAGSQKIPACLISNLGGVWNVLLRYAVQKNGGKTIVIDHGCGSALYTYPVNGLSNYAGTSVFYAFSPAAKALLEKNLWPAFKVLFPGLKIDSFHHAEHIHAQARQDEKPKSILLIPLAPIYDRGLGGPYPSTVQAVDFNARLVAAFQNQGYDVTIKQHPAFMEFPPDLYREKYGAPCATEPFEKIFRDYEILVNCDFSSTTLVPSLYSSKPLLLINTNPTFYSSDAVKLLENRTEIGTISYDSANRAQIDWNGLANMVAASILKAHNTDFIPLFQEP